VSEALGSAVLELRTDDQGLERGIAGAKRAAGGLETSFKSLSARLNKFGDNMTRIGGVLSIGVTAPIALMGKAILGAAGDFEQGMNLVRAVSGATGSDFDALQAQARELGATTVFSAGQAADGMAFLARAGFGANEIIAAMPGMLNLAAAGQLELGAAADIASNIMQGFGIAASESGRVADVLAAAAASANTDVLQLGQAMKFVAPVARAAGVSVEQASSAVGLLSNAGIQGAMAGTSLRRAIAELITPTSKINEALEEAGQSAFNAAGKIKPLPDILDAMRAAGLDAADMMGMFGQRAGPAMIELMAQGGAALRTFTERMEESGGTAARIAGVQMEGFKGAVVELRSALEGLAIAVASSGILEFATTAAHVFTQAVRWISDADAGFVRFAATIAALFAAAGPILLAIGLFSKVLAAVFVVATGPVGLTIAAAGLLTAVWVGWGDAITDLIRNVIEWLRERLLALALAAVEVAQKVMGLVGQGHRLQDMADSLRGKLIDLEREGIRKAATAMEDAGRAAEKMSGDKGGGGGGMSTIPPVVEDISAKLKKMQKDADEAFDKLLTFTQAAERAGFAALGATENSLPYVEYLREQKRLLEENQFHFKTFADAAENAGFAVLGATENSAPSLEWSRKQAKELTFLQGVARGFGRDWLRMFNVLSGTAAPGEIGRMVGNIAKSVLSGVVNLIRSGFSAIIGTAFQRALNNPKVQEALENLVEMLEPLVEVIADVLVPIFEALGPAIEPIVRGLIPIVEALGAILLDVIEIFQPVFEALEPLLRELAILLVELSPLIRFLAQIIAAVLVPVIRVLTFIIGALISVMRVLNNVGSFLADGMQALRDVFRWLGDSIQTLIDVIRKFNPFGGGGGGGGGFDSRIIFPGLPRLFHEGSDGPLRPQDLLRLPGMAPDEGLGVLQTGETVTARGGEGGERTMTVTLNGSDNATFTRRQVRGLVEQIRDELRDDSTFHLVIV
jgi:TP901 family phage tail tape measure protein